MSPEDSDQQEEFTWEAYYKSLEGREPRHLFTEALAKYWHIFDIIARKLDPYQFE